MYIARCVLVMTTWQVAVVHSWDIAISIKHQLILYTNGIKTSTVNLDSRSPTSLVYDEVHNMMLYVDKQNNNDSICGYGLSSEENKCFIKRNGRNIHGLAYDPVTEKIFFTDTIEKSINFISKKRGSNNNIYGEQLIKMDDQAPADIAVDSCKGYIYWSHTNSDGKIERFQFNGSNRKVMSLLLTSVVYKPFSLSIDPQTQKIFYFDVCEGCRNWMWYLNRADLNGTNDKILARGSYESQPLSRVLTVSKDYIYWTDSSGNYDSIWQLPKKEANDGIESKEISKHNERILGLVAKYKIEDQIKGIQDCVSLSRLKLTIHHGDGSELCDVPVCTNYCLQGTCSVNDEGHPKCSCNAGYTGGRCEVSTCHGFCLNDGACSLNGNSEPVCQCKGDYLGDRCEITKCLNYCIEGNCSLNSDGLPKCSCNVGYSGERCEVSVCHSFCLNDGECSLNEEDEQVCQCVGNYVGARCEADTIDTTPTYDLAQRNLALVDILSTWRKPSSKMYVLVEV